MSISGPYDVCKMYLRLKLHFTGKMGYFDYHDTNFTIDSYRNRNDRWAFENIHAIYGKDSKRFLLSSFVGIKHTSSEIYSNTLLDDKFYEDQWNRFQRVESNILGTFKTDVASLIRKHPDKNFKRCIISSPNRMPLLLRRFFTDDINIESYIILNKIISFSDIYSSTYSLDPRVTRLHSVCLGYSDFVKVDVQGYKGILQKIIKMESD